MNNRNHVITSNGCNRQKRSWRRGRVRSSGAVLSIGSYRRRQGRPSRMLSVPSLHHQKSTRMQVSAELTLPMSSTQPLHAEIPGVISRKDCAEVIRCLRLHPVRDAARLRSNTDCGNCYIRARRQILFTFWMTGSALWTKTAGRPKLETIPGSNTTCVFHTADI